MYVFQSEDCIQSYEGCVHGVFVGVYICVSDVCVPVRGLYTILVPWSSDRLYRIFYLHTPIGFDIGQQLSVVRLYKSNAQLICCAFGQALVSENIWRNINETTLAQHTDSNGVINLIRSKLDSATCLSFSVLFISVKNRNLIWCFF